MAKMVVCYSYFFLSLFTLLYFQPIVHVVVCRRVTESHLMTYREKVLQMFYHAYDNYMHNAYPYDELRPLSCDGVDTWGSFSLTLIDVLDTLAVIGNYSEFRRVAQLLIDNANFDMNINVSVFETNIRVVGGLLSAHLLSHRAGLVLEPGWPCSGPLLRLAEDMARRLLPAFETETGMPYGTVNLRNGVPRGETPITCTAGVGTFILEFGTLSRLTGDPSFENAAMKALYSLWYSRSSIGLVGNHIDVLTGKWTALDSGIGAGVDSYYEYLVKGSVLLQKPELMSMFREYQKSINRYMIQDDWYMWVSMQKGQVTLPVFQSLEAYWPGLLTLVGDISPALKTVHNYHQVWKQFGFTPEFYNILQSEPNNNREGYPLRPELIESLMCIYKATKDPVILQMGVDILESIQYSARTPCGYATIKDVRSHMVEDRMESFFLAETTKYLYLLFSPDNFVLANGSTGTVIQSSHGECIIDAGGYIFNTEAHPIDVASVHCCGAGKEEELLLQNFHDNMDLLTLLSLQSDGDFLKPFGKRKPNKPLKEWLMPTENETFIESPSVESIFTVTVNLSDSPDSMNGKRSSSDSGDQDLNEEQKTTVINNATTITENQRMVEDHEKIDISTRSQQSVFSEVFNQTQGPSVPDQNQTNAKETNGSITPSPTLLNDKRENTPIDDALSPISDNSKTVQKNNNVKLASSLEYPGTGYVTYLGEITDELTQSNTVEEDYHECTSATNIEMSTESPPLQDDSYREKILPVEGQVWSGTKSVLSNVQRDTLYSSGFSGVTGIGLMGMERNNSSVQFRYVKLKPNYEVLSCPAQPFTLRFSILGEMFGVN